MPATDLLRLAGNAANVEVMDYGSASVNCSTSER